MRDITTIVTTAMRESRAWPAVFETGAAQELWRAAHEALTAAGFVIVPREPTPEMIAAAALMDIYAPERRAAPYSLWAAGLADMACQPLAQAPKIGGDDDRS